MIDQVFPVFLRGKLEERLKLFTFYKKCLNLGEEMWPAKPRACVMAGHIFSDRDQVDG